MPVIQFRHTYHDIISVENLLEAWREFIKGKKARKDVQEFGLNLMRNILELHRDLVSKEYRHSSYHAFTISDPKPRNIHKASVRDRLLHHALHRMLYPFFDKTFISDSYSCRFGGGTHKATARFKYFLGKASENHTRTVWVLKCDVRKFFASIDQKILIRIVQQYVPDQDIVGLISKIIESFNSGQYSKGLPLGNLTSQLLVNVYMNVFDQFVKHKLKVKYYIRYADDFVIVCHDHTYLTSILSKVRNFLLETLKLNLNPKKISLNTLASGIDFLGWVHFVDHRVLRSVTRKRMLRNIQHKNYDIQTLQSYLGLMKHGNTQKLQNVIKNNKI